MESCCFDLSELLCDVVKRMNEIAICSGDRNEI